jgi:starch synthase
VLETVKKLRWRPDVIHCHGWFSSIVPIYLRSSFADDPMLKDVKVVMSLYDKGFDGEIGSDMRSKIEDEKACCGNMSLLDRPTYQNFMQYVIDGVDGVVVEQEGLCDRLVEIVRLSGKKSLWRFDHPKDEFWDSYKRFYDEL